MRFLVDNNLPTQMASGLRAAGHDAIHVRDLDLSSADDERIFAIAEQQKRTIVSQDADFGSILAIRRTAEPSVLLFRRRHKSVGALLPTLLAALPRLTREIESGAVIVIEDTRIRVRRLPIFGAS